MHARISNRLDSCSRAVPQAAGCTHLSLDWQVDFTSRTLVGSAAWTVSLGQGDTSCVVMDTKQLEVSSVTVENEPAHFTLGEEHHAFGQALTIQLNEQARAKTEIRVVVAYKTSPQSSALQWLTKELTAGQVHPYLFTQCEPIHARALLPCQDTPSAKFSYDAAVTVPGWATALMSAIGKGSKRKSDQDDGTRIFYFEQKIVIPAYLLCLAVGHLQSREASKIQTAPCI